MSSRILNEEISMSNIKAWVETGLRQMKVIQDHETVDLLTFQTIAQHTTVGEWEARKTVPLQLKLTNEKELDVRHLT